MAKNLRISNLHKRHRALTPALSASYFEAASVCLSRHHVPPITIELTDAGTTIDARIKWALPNDRTRDAWANTIDTTEAGAYCCAIAAVEKVRGLRAVRRAETGTGADYYIGPPGSGKRDLENCQRLEVSGVDGGDKIEVARRLTQKVSQARNGNSSLPALAGVVGFLSRIVSIQDD